MCYSAMVEQNPKKYEFRYKATVQTELYEELFRRRLLGEKLYLNKAMEYQFTHEAKSALEKKIANEILKWHEKQIPLLEQDLFKQKKRLADANRTLSVKHTKKAENDQRISSNKIEKILSDLEKNRSLEIVSESEERIFPLHYMTMLCLDDSGEKVVRPVRYLMRPHNKDEKFDAQFSGCYNARFDSLESVPWWADSFRKRHGLILVKKFYENVETKEYLKRNSLPADQLKQKKIVLCFQPDNVEYMFIPTIWDEWKATGQPHLYSAALITDQPAPEIAMAGHDRTPVFLKESVIEDWLNCQGKSPEAIRKVLNTREKPHYSHHVLGAA
jgi:putative SOS response-associated peptidase YedK